MRAEALTLYNLSSEGRTAQIQYKSSPCAAGASLSENNTRPNKRRKAYLLGLVPNDKTTFVLIVLRNVYKVWHSVMKHRKGVMFLVAPDLGPPSGWDISQSNCLIAIKYAEDVHALKEALQFFPTGANISNFCQFPVTDWRIAKIFCFFMFPTWDFTFVLQAGF